MASNMILYTSQSTQEVKKICHGDFNYKLGPTYGESIPKFAVRPSFFNITNPNLGPASLEITPMALNMILDTSQSTQEVKKMCHGGF